MDVRYKCRDLGVADIWSGCRLDAILSALIGSEMGLVWSGDTNKWTWMEVRHQIDGSEAHISRPVWGENGLSWDTQFETWILWGENRMWLRCNSPDPEGSEMWNVWLWEEYIMTWFVFIWGATWIEVRSVWTCMEAMQYMDGGEAWILGPWCRSGRPVMVVKHIFLYFDMSQMGPGWSWEDAV